MISDGSDFSCFSSFSSLRSATFSTTWSILGALIGVPTISRKGSAGVSTSLMSLTTGSGESRA
jgi:hypothetical protein